MPTILKYFIGAVALVLLVLITDTFSQQTGENTNGLLNHPKLHGGSGILADFNDKKTSSMVIVLLEPSPEAVGLARQFRNRPDIPKEFNRPGAPPYYDFKNKKVKEQVRNLVTEKVNRVATAFSSPEVRIRQKLSYQFAFAAEVTRAGLQRLVDSPEVVAVEKDQMLLPHLNQGIPLINGTTARTTYDGSGLSIAICDTGIDTAHPRLGADDSAIFNSKVIGGYDTGDDDGDPRPGVTGEAHGTACAAIAAGDLGTVGDYIGGVAPGAKLYALKISYGIGGNAYSTAMVAAWEWCITHQDDDPANPIMIISTSFGGGKYSALCDSASLSMTTAASNAVAAGITLFVSSGNNGYCDSIAWPACISYVNSVGAVYDAAFGIHYPCVSVDSCVSKTTPSSCSTNYYATDVTAADMVASYSNSAFFLTMLAPANQAYTADITGTGGYNTALDGDYYSSFGGTSAACPYAAGAAAVLQQAAKNIKGSHLSPAQVKSYLVTYGNYLTDGKVAITKPRINLGAAINGLSIPPTPSSFPLHLFMAPVLAAANNSYWDVTTTVCCIDSSITFTLNHGSISRSAILAGCMGTPSSQGYAPAGSGLEYFTWSLVTPTCGSYSGSFFYSLVKRNKYLFYPALDINGNLIIRVTITDTQNGMISYDTIITVSAFSQQTAAQPSSGGLQSIK
ncbi:MAG: S8 family serine peptidase [Desulfobulbaceae bacterium]|nr:S8 family serine peptidase [Desulfobulbaceae bacterium]